jgi:hypothetical protein
MRQEIVNKAVVSGICLPEVLSQTVHLTLKLSVNLNDSTFSPNSLFLSLILIGKQTKITALQGTDWFL